MEALFYCKSYLVTTGFFVFVNTTNSVTYQIVNSLGKVIEEGKLDRNVETKDVSYLSSGVYHIRLISLETKDRCHEKFIFVKKLEPRVGRANTGFLKFKQ